MHYAGLLKMGLQQEAALQADRLVRKRGSFMKRRWDSGMVQGPASLRKQPGRRSGAVPSWACPHRWQNANGHQHTMVEHSYSTLCNLHVILCQLGSCLHAGDWTYV